VVATTRITRDDLEAKLRDVSGGLDQKVEAAKPRILAGAVGGVFVIALLAYLLGRRRGRSRSAVVEIRRL